MKADTGAAPPEAKAVGLSQRSPLKGLKPVLPIAARSLQPDGGRHCVIRSIVEMQSLCHASGCQSAPLVGFGFVTQGLWSLTKWSDKKPGRCAEARPSCSRHCPQCRRSGLRTTPTTEKDHGCHFDWCMTISPGRDPWGAKILLYSSSRHCPICRPSGLRTTPTTEILPTPAPLAGFANLAQASARGGSAPAARFCRRHPRSPGPRSVRPPLCRAQ